MCDVALGILAYEVEGFVFFLDELGVGAGVVSADKSFSDADVLVAPVEVSQVHRTIHSPGDGVVSHLPAFHRLAGAFRCYAQVEFSLRLFHFRDDASYYGGAVSTVYRDAAEFAENRPERPEEKLFLYHDMCDMSEALVIEVRHQKVRDACMGNSQYDAFLLRSRTAVRLPPECFHYACVEIVLFHYA